MTTPTTDTDRLAEIRRHMEMAQVATANAPGTFWHIFVADAARLLAENARLRERLDTAEGLHKPVRRYTGPDTDDRSFETAEEAAEYDDVAVEAVTYFEVCGYCGDLETHDDEWRSYDWSLWPCKEAKALGLDSAVSR